MRQIRADRFSTRRFAILCHPCPVFRKRHTMLVANTLDVFIPFSVAEKQMRLACVQLILIFLLGSEANASLHDFASVAGKHDLAAARRTFSLRTVREIRRLRGFSGRSGFGILTFHCRPHRIFKKFGRTLLPIARRNVQRKSRNCLRYSLTDNQRPHLSRRFEILPGGSQDYFHFFFAEIHTPFFKNSRSAEHGNFAIF